eukprot:scaffold117905_cov60-Attheya_sp.AAC.1
MEGGLTIIRLEAAASSRSFMDLLLDLVLSSIIEGGWVMGMEIGLQMHLNLDVLTEGMGHEGFGLDIRG